MTCEDLGRDRYKRIIARCTVAGVDLGEWMVAQGWAVAYYLGFTNSLAQMPCRAAWASASSST